MKNVRKSYSKNEGLFIHIEFSHGNEPRFHHPVAIGMRGLFLQQLKYCVKELTIKEALRNSWLERELRISLTVMTKRRNSKENSACVDLTPQILRNSLGGSLPQVLPESHLLSGIRECNDTAMFGASR